MNLEEVLAYSNQKLFDELKKRGASVGPVTDGTKKIYANKLMKLMQQNEEADQPSEMKVKTKKKSKKRQSIQQPQIDLQGLQENDYEVLLAGNTEQNKVVKQTLKQSKKGRKRNVVIKSVPVEEPVEEKLVESTVSNKEELSASNDNLATGEPKGTESSTISTSAKLEETESSTISTSAKLEETESSTISTSAKLEETESSTISTSAKLEETESSTILTSAKPLNSSWKSSNMSFVTRAELIQTALKKRRPLYENEVELKNSANLKLQETEIEQKEPKKTSINFCALLVIFAVVTMLIWVVYSAMEQNPSALELL